MTFAETLRICGIVKDRSGGKTSNAASVIMQRHPKWPAFICSIATWHRVEPGTLTLDNCSPLPQVALNEVTPLALEPPPETLFGNDPSYVRLMRKRGQRRFYCGVAKSESASYPVVISQQAVPACDHRLEVYAEARLRDVLKVTTGDRVCVEVVPGLLK